MIRLRPRCLVACGCSFTQVPNADTTWPVHLRDYLSHVECAYFVGQGAAGNGIISRRAIYHTLKALKSYDPQEILVGIMWSGADRSEIYQNDPQLIYNLFTGNEFYCNPVRIADDYNFYLLNSHWDDEATITYYKNFYNQIYSYIITIEHILRTQWFLKQHNIPYFMTEYSFDVLPKDDNIINHPEIKYLYNMIDRSNWLNIDNMWQYAVDSGLPFARPPDPHPSTEHHEKFTREVIISYLHRKNYF